MKSTGIVRRIDSFGRVVLPMELRKLMDLHQDTAVELFVDGENIILHKYNPACIAAASTAQSSLKASSFAKTAQEESAILTADCHENH